MSSEKKLIRQNFRDSVFTRDAHKCRGCGWSIQTLDLQLDAHHITDRNLMPNGGYVKENGISLCPGCHEKAEVFHSTGTPVHGFAPEDLYRLIGSSYDHAVVAAEKLTNGH